MRHPKLARIVAVLVACSTAVVLSQETIDLGVIDRIKDEAFGRSEVMDHLRNLTDVHGPRLTGSPQFEEAAKWTAERLTAYGLSNVHVERWGPFGRSWSVEQYSAEQLAPHYTRLAAMPLAWSASTPSPVTGEPMLTPLETSFESGGFKKIAENFDAYRRQWSGKLRGKILLLTPVKPEQPRESHCSRGTRMLTSPRSPLPPNRWPCCGCRRWTISSGRRSRRRCSRSSWRCRRRSSIS
jgi:carboxypeptidase Q